MLIVTFLQRIAGTHGDVALKNDTGGDGKQLIYYWWPYSVTGAYYFPDAY